MDAGVPSTSQAAVQALKGWELVLGCTIPAPAAVASVQSVHDPDAEPVLVPAALLVEHPLSLQSAPLAASLCAEITGDATLGSMLSAGGRAHLPHSCCCPSGAVGHSSIWASPLSFDPPVFVDFSQRGVAEVSWTTASNAPSHHGAPDFQQAFRAAQPAQPQAATQQRPSVRRWTPTPVVPGTALAEQLQQQADAKTRQALPPRSPRPALPLTLMSSQLGPLAPAASVLSCEQPGPRAKAAAQSAAPAQQTQPATPAIKPAAARPVIPGVKRAGHPAVSAVKPAAAAKKQKTAAVPAAAAGDESKAAARKRKPAEALDAVQVLPC